ncbi:MAG: hypothetical protein KDM91_17070 [Verrucomicrobiae bacterium]|nr:hypothetical protein [Verrucomicrobiae bacterium]MCP5541645.1 hypothetical protein [Akkermansiaceae bacterium]MCP5549290.1 hypothetical protein [Akkermansiaceae bacterium]
MRHNPNRFFAKLSMLICCLTLFSAQPAQCGALSDWLSGFMEWLAGLNGDTNATTGTGSDTGTTADSPAGTNPADSGAAPPANTIAQSCANDSGNASSQYTRYGENLAMTLAQLTPEQRSRVFGGN